MVSIALVRMALACMARASMVVLTVAGQSVNGYGVYASSGNNYAAYLDGSVYIRGPLQKPGGQFKIDHPLNPASKYLCHSFVESPDMKNVYDGVVILDKKGEAEVDLPDWFSALNKDYRYQLTAIGVLDQISTLQKKYLKLKQIILIPQTITTTIIAVLGLPAVLEL